MRGIGAVCGAVGLPRVAPEGSQGAACGGRLRRAASLLRGHERLYGLARVGGYVRVRRVHRLRVRPLVPYPFVNDGFCLDELLAFPRCKLPLVHVASFLLALLCLALNPSTAKAEIQWVTKYESTNGPAGFVYPHPYTEDGRWAALSEFLGFNWDSFSLQQKQDIQAETEIASILHNDNNVRNIAYGISDSTTPDWIKTIDDSILQLFGGNTIYAIEMSNEDYRYAQDIFEYWAFPRVEDDSVIDGNEYYVFDCLTNYDGSGNGLSLIDSVTGTYYNNSTLPSSIKVYISKSYFNYDLSSYNAFLLYLTSSSTSSNNSIFAFQIYFCSSFVSSISISTKDTSFYSSFISSSPVRLFSRSGTEKYYYHDGVLFIYFSSSSSSVGQSWNSGKVNATRKGLSGVLSGSQNYVPTPDPAPEPPSEPVGGTPEQPTTQQPAPTTPQPGTDITINLPTVPTYEPFVGDSIDYTSWLDEIIELLQSIDTHLVSFWRDNLRILDNIDDNIYNLVNNVNAGFANIHADFGWLGDFINDQIYSSSVYLANAIGSWVKWLAKQLNFDFDDSGILSWLKRIYSRLGGNGVSKPDPSLDEPGFWDWLTKQFTDFFSDLLGDSADAVGDLLDELKGFFPFSIPWDLYAIFALLAHEPVVPVFDLPLPVPAVIDADKLLLVHVDCTPWDGVARAVRGFELLAFAYGLARMVPEWFNHIKVGDF